MSQGVARFGYAPSQALRPDWGVGKWSRIMCYGARRQQQPDGSLRDFKFDPASFQQAVANFKRMFAGRGKGMGSDYEHQSLNAASNGQAAPNLCFFGAMAHVDASGAVVGQEHVRPGLPEIDPAAERARLAQQNPEADSDPAGLWVCCAEVTPLGIELIPNYSQLSPAFDDHDKDEQGQDIGLAVQNVSFVNTAFQTGTAFNFGKSSAALAPSTEKRMNPEMIQKLGKYGYAADKPESIDEAYHGFMSSEEPAGDRAAMAKAYRAYKMSADPQSGGPGSMPAGAPAAAPPVLAAPGSMADPPALVPDKDADGMAKMNKVLEGQVAALSKHVKQSDAALAELKAEIARKERDARIAAFRKEMTEGVEARYAVGAPELETLIEAVGGDVDKARPIAMNMPPLAAFKRYTEGGHVLGTKSVPTPGIAQMSRAQVGAAFSKRVRELRDADPALSLEDAQQRVAREQPELYNAAVK